MRIAIDARKLHDFGIGTYIRNLLKYLARLDQETEYVLLCRPQDAEAVPTPRARTSGPWSSASKPYSVAEQFMLPARLAARSTSTCSTSRTTCCRRWCRAARS